MAFVLVRFSPRAYLSLHLTIGVVLLVGASWMFGAIAEDVTTGEAVVGTIDQRSSKVCLSPYGANISDVFARLHSRARRVTARRHRLCLALRLSTGPPAGSDWLLLQQF